MNAKGPAELTLQAERCRAILDFAKASYISESLYNDPSLTKGIDNVLCLLLRLVLQVREEGACYQGTISLHAGERLVGLLRSHIKLPRSVRRWLTEHEMLFVLLAEHMVEALKHDDVPTAPAYPIHGIPKYKQIEGPSPPHPVHLRITSDDGSDKLVPFGHAQMIGTWRMDGFIELPLPDWWHGLNRRWPARAAVHLDRIAHEILMENAD